MGTTTPNLNLYEPSVGETGWGTLVNGNFTTLDNAVVGPAPTITGTVTAQGLVDISGAGAGQIKFPGTQNASANVNTLDDYEEGNWTLSVGGTATYALQTGKYTKIGRVVTVHGELVITTLGTGSTNTISGLPFTADKFSAGALYWASAAVAPVYAVAIVSSGAATVVLNGITAANATISTINLLGNGAAVAFTIVYETAT